MRRIDASTERRLADGFARALRRPGMRETLGSALFAALMLLGAVVLATRAPAARELDPPLALAFTVALAVLSRVRFHAGAGHTVPRSSCSCRCCFVLPTAARAAARGRRHGARQRAGLRCAGDRPRPRADAAGRRLARDRPGARAARAGVTAPALARLAGATCSPSPRSSRRRRLLRCACPAGARHLRSRQLRPCSAWSRSSTRCSRRSACWRRSRRPACPTPSCSCCRSPRCCRDLRARAQRAHRQALELGGAYRGTALLLGDVLEEDDEYTGGDHTRGRRRALGRRSPTSSASTGGSATTSSSRRCCTTSARSSSRRRSSTSPGRSTTTSGR